MLGRARAAAELIRLGLEATPATVRSVWQRHGLQNATKRVAAFAPPADPIEAVAADDTIVLPAPHEIPPRARPSTGPMADALVFSVAVLSALDHHTSEPLDQPNVHDLPLIDQTMLFADDATAGAQAPVDTADIFHSSQPHFDFLLA